MGMLTRGGGLLANVAEAAKLYVDDVFSTYLYTGNGSTQTITNGIDLAGQGGLVWVKARVSDLGNVAHVLSDTARGVGQRLSTNAADGQTAAAFLDSFNSNGFTLNNGGLANYGTGTNNYASWTFRKAPKFFDIVTWTGNGSNRNIAHNLGVEPGCILVKRTDNPGDWQVYHRSIPNTNYLVLNSTAASATGATRWNSTTATASVFSLGTATDVNANGGTYVAYVFAHDAATDGLIQCGTFTTDATGNASVDLGWEPQYVLTKTSTAGSNWVVVDSLRGMVVGGDDQVLRPNLALEEITAATLSPTATGFDATSLSANQTNVYIAIRRPNKPPTVGTQVFLPAKAVAPSSPYTIQTNFPVDMMITLFMVGGFGSINDRLRGATTTYYSRLNTQSSDPEFTGSGVGLGFDSNTSAVDNAYSTPSAGDVSYLAFRRAPGFFDVVAYTGNDGEATIAPHSLGRPPEMIIAKSRTHFGDWYVYHAALGNASAVILNADIPAQGDLVEWSVFTPNATTFRTSTSLNSPGFGYIAYLFATLAGISKVGSYTGNGSSKTINCGFTTGARFVLIKRTDSTGDWFVWDTARGIVSGNDPHLSLNTTAAEVTTDDSIDPTGAGFIVNQVVATNVNVNAATYIFLAIA